MDSPEVKRKLAAILYADVAGYSRLMGDDEEATLKTLNTYRTEIDSLIVRHDGRVVDMAGDSVLAEFASAVEAVRCGVEIQKTLKQRNGALPPDRRMIFRIGINLGDVMSDGKSVFGDGVNVAARLEALAEPGGVTISGTVFDHVRDRMEIDFEDLGEHSVKNIARVVHVYRVPVAGSKGVPTAARSVADAPPALPDRPSIAVLPFQNMSGDTDQEYFSDGISEDIITDLSKVSGLLVIARNSTFVYKGKSPDVKAVGSELGVRYIVEGSVRRAGERVRITAQLIDAQTGGHLWAERYDRDLKDVFAVQDEVTRRIVSALEVKLTEGEEQHLHDKGTENLEAYESLLRGKHSYLRFTKEANDEARQMYERAIELDPDYAAPYAELARVHVQARNHGWADSLDEALDRAFGYAQRAVEVDADLAQAHIVLGFINVWRKDHDEAIGEVEKGLVLDPNHADGHMYRAIALGFAGKTEESVRTVAKAMRLNPAAPFWYLWALGNACFSLGHYEDAVNACRKATVSNPNFLFANLCLAASYGQLGRTEEAAAAAADCQRIVSSLSLDWAGRVVPFKDATVQAGFLSGLRAAGIPD